MDEIGTHSVIERADVVTLDLKVRAPQFYPHRLGGRPDAKPREEQILDSPHDEGGTMFGAAEMQRGNLKGPERSQIEAALRTFSAEVREACLTHGLGVGEVPFIRPANFLVVLNPDAVHLVVDDVPVGSIPDHTYLDRRQDIPILPLNAVVGAAVREFGFREPVGVTLPLQALSDHELQRKSILRQVASKSCLQLAERAAIRNLRLPQGYRHFSRFFPDFLADHPDKDKNVFLMMRFKSGAEYDLIHSTLKDGLRGHGLSLLRADDKDYTGDLWENVCLYMLGCAYGVAVFEEIDLREFNPSVALELGFMLAHNKRTLILKDKRMPRMPTDIVGKLYKEFDTYKIAETIDIALRSWVRDIGLA